LSCTLDSGIRIFVGDVLSLSHRTGRRLMVKLRAYGLGGCGAGNRRWRRFSYLLLKLVDLFGARTAQRYSVAADQAYSHAQSDQTRSRSNETAVWHMALMPADTLRSCVN
jgi:hypothetical protein